MAKAAVVLLVSVLVAKVALVLVVSVLVAMVTEF